MNDSKSAITSLGIIGPLIGAVVFAVNRYVFGHDVISPDDVSTVQVAGSAAVEQLSVLWATGTAIYGRWRATKQITGIVVAK